MLVHSNPDGSLVAQTVDILLSFVIVSFMVTDTKTFDSRRFV